MSTPAGRDHDIAPQNEPDDRVGAARDDAARSDTTGDERSAELDRLSADCLAAPERIEPQIALWRAVAALDHWFFINRGEAENQRPYALAAPSGNLVCVYSSPSRARDAARAAGLIAADASVELLSVAVPGAIDWVLTLGERGVSGVVVDHPQIGAWTPLPNLERLRAERTPPV